MPKNATSFQNHLALKITAFFRRRKISFSRKPRPRFWIKARSSKNRLQLRNWQLVLVSQAIPYRIYRVGGSYQIYVPPLLAEMAAWQIATYERENSLPKLSKISWPAAPHAFLVFLPLFLLAIMHAIRQNGIVHPAFLPDPALWLKAGAMDSVRVHLYGEYQRAITALTLHVNDSHLTGNLFFGALFLFMLARRAGYGRAFLLATVCGAAGNLAALPFHSGPWLSVGFSTAVFAAAGALAGIMTSTESNRRKLLLPAGAALALLALLGTEGENTDYAAHCAGLACGFLGGLWEGWRRKRKIPGLSNFFAFLLAFAIYLAAWHASFNF